MGASRASVVGALLLVFACSSSAKPDSETAALRADVDMMCGAAKATGATTFMQVGPYIAEHMKTSHKIELFADVRTRTLDELLARMRDLAAKAGVQQCDTIDVLVANDPRKRGE
jgi:hypothetical protein